MTATLRAFREGFPDFLLMTGTAGVLLVVAATIYILLTPWKELALVRGGNGAAGLALSGANCRAGNSDRLLPRLQL